VVPFKVEGSSSIPVPLCAFLRQWLVLNAFNCHIDATLIFYIHKMVFKLYDVQTVALKLFCAFDSILATIFDSIHI
jgi:hypothetical protein